MQHKRDVYVSYWFWNIMRVTGLSENGNMYYYCFSKYLGNKIKRLLRTNDNIRAFLADHFDEPEEVYMYMD